MKAIQQQGISGWQALSVIATCVAMMIVIVSLAPQ
jgi:hypothetical protein